MSEAETYPASHYVPDRGLAMDYPDLGADAFAEQTIDHSPAYTWVIPRP